MATPYEEIADVISDWCETHGYEDFLVTIDLDGDLITEVLEFDGNKCEFVWSMDWWEGEKNVSLVGFRPIRDIKFYGPPAPNTNDMKVRAMSDEELAHWLVERVTDSPWCKPDAPVDPETKRCQIWDCEKCALEWLRQEAKPCTK